MWGLALRIGSSLPVQIALRANQDKDHECNANCAKRAHYDQCNHGGSFRQAVKARPHKNKAMAGSLKKS
jgi:hypothetical protein